MNQEGPRVIQVIETRDGSATRYFNLNGDLLASTDARDDGRAIERQRIREILYRHQAATGVGDLSMEIFNIIEEIEKA